MPLESIRYTFSDTYLMPLESMPNAIGIHNVASDLVFINRYNGQYVEELKEMQGMIKKDIYIYMN
jgi:hypothetical protein